ncbi:hypothetical protein [Protaetiibacter intestinalis]|uniref:Multidrug ABC transporter ATPase n=1 Tax=Protaetiibacter intestinalis TaxID=2419774 RepID=A0A387B1K8_9MICO|nr:hypothetical protein [Protaetiibacter intestinalis]AYF97392.1 hypothetical protein D7I47_03420 [Protaetiibacter intestinalis]
MPENAPVPLNRIERVLTAMIATIMGLSIIGIVVVMIAAGSGVEMKGGIWPTLVLIGYIGLPLAFVLIVVFLIVSTTRRRRLARDGER